MKDDTLRRTLTRLVRTHGTYALIRTLAEVCARLANDTPEEEEEEAERLQHAAELFARTAALHRRDLGKR
jgi:hypothetical protein